MSKKKPTLKELVSHQKKVTKATIMLDATQEDVDWLHSGAETAPTPAETPATDES